MTQRVAAYRIIDLRSGQRLHIWGVGADERYAVGHGPIRDITREEAERLLHPDHAEGAD